jgi:hypothetical protein
MAKHDIFPTVQDDSPELALWMLGAGTAQADIQAAHQSHRLIPRGFGSVGTRGGFASDDNYWALELSEQIDSEGSSPAKVPGT